MTTIIEQLYIAHQPWHELIKRQTLLEMRLQKTSNLEKAQAVQSASLAGLACICTTSKDIHSPPILEDEDVWPRCKVGGPASRANQQMAHACCLVKLLDPFHYDYIQGSLLSHVQTQR